MADGPLDDLKSLHTAAIDARNGYSEALEDAKGHGLTGLFQDMIALHGINAEELRRELAAGGEDVDNEGSFMSTVHRTIISIRSLFGGLDKSVLPGLIDGEERNISKYNDVLASSLLPTETRSLLVKQRDRIASAVAGMKRSE